MPLAEQAGRPSQVVPSVVLFTTVGLRELGYVLHRVSRGESDWLGTGYGYYRIGGALESNPSSSEISAAVPPSRIN